MKQAVKEKLLSNYGLDFEFSKGLIELNQRNRPDISVGNFIIDEQRKEYYSLRWGHNRRFICSLGNNNDDPMTPKEIEESLDDEKKVAFHFGEVFDREKERAVILEAEAYLIKHGYYAHETSLERIKEERGTIITMFNKHLRIIPFEDHYIKALQTFFAPNIYKREWNKVKDYKRESGKWEYGWFGLRNPTSYGTALPIQLHAYMLKAKAKQ